MSSRTFCRGVFCRCACLKTLARVIALFGVFASISYAQSPVVTLAPTSLTFASQVVGTPSPTQTVTLTNTGSATLSITKINITGPNIKDYSQTNNCGKSLAAGASCTITVTFTPSAKGTRTANVSVTDNATGSPQTVSLTGTGIAPFVKLTPSSLTFAGQQVGTTSASQSVTLKNTGNATLTINSITANGDFAQTNTCGSTLAISASCTLSVTFTPTASGTRTGSVSISDNAIGSPQAVTLTGTGLAPVVTLSPTALTFISQTVGTTSSPQTVTLTNTGNSSLTITSIAATGDYAQTNTCGSTVNAGANCSISVTFTPTTTGTRTGAVTIADNATGSPQTVSLSGTGTTSTAPAVSLSTTSLTFGNQVVGTTSSPQSVTLTNTGNATLTITTIVASGDYAQTNTCGSNVVAGANCSVSVTFTPATTGTRTGTITFTDDAGDSPETVSLTGTGMLAVASPTLTVLGPGPRIRHSAALDSATNSMITFGGQNTSINNFNDVWQSIVYEDVTVHWLPVNPSGTPPAARYGHTGVYDPTNSRMMIFAGAQGVGTPAPCQNDMWVLQNANALGGTPTWVQLSASGGPPTARYGHASVYDPSTNSMIVFGGSDCASGLFNDVWVLSNANGLGGTPVWTQLSPGGSAPSGREASSAIYDTTNNVMVVYGGDQGSSATLGDVWVLFHANGIGGTPTWTQLFPTGTAPSARTGQSAVYDSANNRMMVFGGVNSAGTVLADTWILTGANGQAGTPAWSLLTVTNGTAKAYHSAVYNAATNEMTVFAGSIGIVPSDDHIFTLFKANGLP